MGEIRSVLFVQEPAILNQQRDMVQRILAEELKASVGFAASPDDVTAGSHYDAVIAPTVSWLPDVLRRLEGLRWVHFLSAGVDRIWDMNFTWSDISVTKSSGVHAAPMSEYAIAAMLHFAKHFDSFVMQSQRSEWRRNWLDELTERVLLVLGMGSVGTAVAQRARVFGMNVHGFARTARFTPTQEQVHDLSELQAMAAVADYVVVALPLTEQTRLLLGQTFFESLKPGAVLVDMSRGGVVSSTALLQAIDNGTLRGAALDVFEEEPLPLGSPLWNRSNVLITPHVAGTTPYYLERALTVFVRNARQVSRGAGLATAVNIQARY